MKKKYVIKEKVWIYPGDTPWHFVTIPAKITEEIDILYSDEKRGWGSLPVLVTLKGKTWRTSIFPDKKTRTYLLPLKAEIRKETDTKDGSIVTITIELGTS